jgi:hypothetical protein
MKQSVALKSGLILALMLAAGAVNADATTTRGTIASITNSTGMVLVNQGKYYSIAQPGQTLNAGDRLMTLAGASASIAYNDGCVQEVKPNSKLVFQSATECSSKTAMIQTVGPHYAALGATQSDAVVDGAAGGGAAGGAAMSDAVGLLAVGGVAGYGAYKVNRNDTPASPQ